MAPDRDPQPTVPESPKDIFERAAEIAKKGTFDPDSYREIGYIFYGRATVNGKPNLPVVITEDYNGQFWPGTRKVTIKSTGKNSANFYYTISHRENDPDHYFAEGRPPSDIGEILSTITRDEKGFEDLRKREKREREEEERVIRRLKRRGAWPRGNLY